MSFITQVATNGWLIRIFFLKQYILFEKLCFVIERKVVMIHFKIPV